METKDKIVKYLPLILFFLVLFFGFLFLKSPKKEINNIEVSISQENILEKNVDVIKKTVATTTTSAKCDGVSLDFDCYFNYYTKLVKEKGTAVAFADLKKKYETNPYVRSQCHPITHVIGRATAIKYPEVSEAYKYGDPFCWSGFYHGVMEEIVGSVGISKIQNKLDSVCNSIPGKDSYSFDYYNCVHGLGHGLMAITENELFDSLRYCDNLNGGWEKNSCYGGVFMENIIVDNKNHFTKYLKPLEPLYPCNSVEAQYKTQCYLMQTSYMLKVTNNDFNKVFELCRNADLGFEAICFQSLGRDASGQSLSNAQETWAKCSLGKDFDEQSNCVVGAVKDFISYYHSDIQANILCATVSPDLQKICLDTGASYYKNLK